MTVEHILQRVKESDHTKVKLAIVDMDGVLRGKLMSREKFLSSLESGFGFCDVVFGWDMVDTSYDNGKFTGWHTGYPDAQASIDLSSFREIPWEDGLPFFLADFSAGKEVSKVCPRSILKSVISKAENMGFQPMFSQEFEWFNFKETSTSWNEKSYHSPDPLTPGMFGYSILRIGQKADYFHDLFDLLEDFRVPLEGLHTETGPGAYEAAIKYSGVLEAADRATLFKTAVKEIASSHGIMASFMAKWDANLPGCGGHIHQSLWKEGENVFFEKGQMSSVMQSYMAGQLECLPVILPMLAPTINSYKRLVEGAWAPTTLTWAVDNRTTALRAFVGFDKASRIENRVVGSDVNPYLSMAACLASGLYGIEQNMNLEIKATVGNGYKDLKNGILPNSLEAATQAMRESSIPVKLFGSAFVEHFASSREWECRQYAKAVTDWELKRYFEII